MWPPWRAAPGHGPFENERRLSEGEIRTIGRWVTAGAPEGKPGDLPAQLAYFRSVEA